MTSWRMKGEYIKNCNCLATCPCDTIGFPAPNQFCEGAFGMQIKEGYFEDVRLDGLRWLGIVHFPGAVHEGNGTIELVIDERANASQREALMEILSGRAGNALFEIAAAVCPNVQGPRFAHIDFEFDQKKRTARVAVPGLFETASMPLTVPATGEEQRVIVRLPEGFEYKEMEVAQAGVLRSAGAIKYEYRGTHSSLALVDHTEQGLQPVPEREAAAARR